MVENRTSDQTGAPSAAGLITVPWNLIVPEVDVHLVGCGNRFPNDFTLEMLAVLRRCKRVFGLPPIQAPEFGIPPMESLLHLYAPDRPRSETYQEMLNLVLDAAVADPPVAFATYGSAMVGAHVAHRLLEEAPTRSLTVHVTNSASCFDAIWADFNIEPFYGVEVWEATIFTHLRITPNTRANLLLPQTAVLDVTEGLDPEAMTMKVSSTVNNLRDHLLRFYPAKHIVHYVTSGAGTGPHLVGPDVESMPLHDLDHPGRNQASTLLVPRLPEARRAFLDFGSPAVR